MPKKLLQGKKILVTRADQQASKLTSLLKKEGAIVFRAPAIRIVRNRRNIAQLDRALERIADYTWLILTSTNSVDIVDELLRKKTGWGVLQSLRIACIGDATAERVKERGGIVSVVPSRFQAEALVEELQRVGVEGANILLPRAAGARPVLPVSLANLGATVHEIHIYRAQLPQSSRAKLLQILETEQLDFITFTSPSTVRNFLEMASPSMTQLDFDRTRIACIGPITAATLKEFGLPVEIEAKEFTMAGLVAALCEYVKR